MTPALGVGTKAAYGLGQAAEGIKDSAFGVFLIFYYVQVLDVPGTLAGAAVGIALIFDAVTDPLAGSLSDNWRSRWGRRHPFLYAAAVPLGVCFYLLFNPPEMSEFGLFLWLTAFAILTRGAMTLYHVPHLSLGAELSDDFEERTTVVAYRYFLRYVGVLSCYALGFGVFFAATEAYPRGQFNLDAYPTFALTLSVLMMVAIAISGIGTHKRIPYLTQPSGPQETLSIGQMLVRMLLELKGALANRSFAWLFSGVLIVFMMVGVDQALNLHMNTYFWELDSQDNFGFFAVYVIGTLIGATFARKLNERFDKKPSIVFGTAWWAALQILPVVLRLLDLFPDNDSGALLPTLMVIRFLQGMGVVQSLITFNSMIADIVDEHELNTGRRQEGIFFASVSFSGKVTTGIGSIIGGIALDVINWPRGVAIQTAADIPPDTLMWLGLIYGPIVSGFAVVSVWCYTRHNLTRERHGEIRRALAERPSRSAQSPAG